MAIARAALSRIQGPATIALDGSTSAWELAALLTDPNLTVVTNSLIITTLLASTKGGPRVVCVGGSLDRDLMIFTGMIALDGLRHTNIDLFFCSCGGMHATRGFSDPSESAAHFKRHLISLAERTIMLADSTKFSARAPVVFAAPGDVSELITDAAADVAMLERFEAAGLACTRVPVA
jgi:DeoR/GlpR family transcriptional regulator of sugar metabolism